MDRVSSNPISSVQEREQLRTKVFPLFLVIRLRDLLDLDCVIDDQVHELVKSSDLAFYADSELSNSTSISMWPENGN